MTSSFLPHAPGRPVAVLLGLMYSGLAVAVVPGSWWLVELGARPHWAVALEFVCGLLSAVIAILVRRRVRAWIVLAPVLALLMAWLEPPWGALSQAALAAHWLISGIPRDRIVEPWFWYLTGLGLAEATLVLLGVVAVAMWLLSLWPTNWAADAAETR